MDIGNINDFFKIYEKDIEDNVILGNALSSKIRNSNILNNTKELIVAAGIENLNIIKCNGVCLVCKKDNIKDISEILRQIENDKKYKNYI